MSGKLLQSWAAISTSSSYESSIVASKDKNKDICFLGQESASRVKRVNETHKERRMTRWVKRPKYSHFLFISLPQHARFSPYPEHLRPPMDRRDRFTARRETCYCTVNLWQLPSPRLNHIGLFMSLEKANTEEEAGFNVGLKGWV